jgi:hypothetical protein
MMKRGTQTNDSRDQGQGVRLHDVLEKSLSAYASAAAAAGVSLVALTPRAEAKIVYTPAKVSIGINSVLALDLNHDGIADFALSNKFARTTDGGFVATLEVGVKDQDNAIWGRGSFYRIPLFASALRRGFEVRPSNIFLAKNSPGVLAFSAYGGYPPETLTYGQWLDTRARYLGLKFIINGQPHYGWARLAVAPGNTGIAATLTGYAYETVPNKPIVTGKTKGPEVITLQPASLGHLAAGASAIPAWRTTDTTTAVRQF